MEIKYSFFFGICLIDYFWKSAWVTRYGLLARSPPGGFGGAEPPQRVDPLPSWLGPAAAAAVEQKSCFDEAENRAVRSLGVGANRYARILCVSKLPWV